MYVGKMFTKDLEYVQLKMFPVLGDDESEKRPRHRASRPDYINAKCTLFWEIFGIERNN